MTPSKDSRADWGQIAFVPIVFLVCVPLIIAGALVDLAEGLYRWYRRSHD